MRSFCVLLFWVLWPLCVLPGFFIDDDGARSWLAPRPAAVPVRSRLCQPRPAVSGARRLPARPAVPALPSSANRSVVVVIGATWGFTLKGRGALRSGEQMHRRQGPLASFAPSGNTDKLAKLYV